jgi:hypothetical protein
MLRADSSMVPARSLVVVDQTVTVGPEDSSATKPQRAMTPNVTASRQGYAERAGPRSRTTATSSTGANVVGDPKATTPAVGGTAAITPPPPSQSRAAVMAAGQRASRLYVSPAKHSIPSPYVAGNVLPIVHSDDHRHPSISLRSSLH